MFLYLSEILGLLLHAPRKIYKQLGFLCKNHISVFFCWSGIKVSTHNNYTFDPAPGEGSTPTGSNGTGILTYLYTTYYFAIKNNQMQVTIIYMDGMGYFFHTSLIKIDQHNPTAEGFGIFRALHASNPSGVLRRCDHDRHEEVATRGSFLESRIMYIMY